VAKIVGLKYAMHEQLPAFVVLLNGLCGNSNTVFFVLKFNEL
jgi:hypothetical protein